jgi:hypothetical protein
MDEEADLALLVSFISAGLSLHLTLQDQHLLKTNLLSQRMTGKPNSSIPAYVMV